MIDPQSISKLCSASKWFELQRTFVDKISGYIEIDIGNLVDADLAKESVSIQALQELGPQALSIANQASDKVLELFGQ